jgi:hypothetical protein
MVRFMVWGGDGRIGAVLLWGLLLVKALFWAAAAEDSASTSDEVLGRCDRIDCLRYIGWMEAEATRSCGEGETETKSKA